MTGRRKGAITVADDRALPEPETFRLTLRRRAALLALLVAAAPPPGRAQESGSPATAAQASAPSPAETRPANGPFQTSTSLIAPSKYGADFRHYDHVNPQAPKGGTLNRVALGSFDSFNPFILRGLPAAGTSSGTGGFGGGVLYDTLMEQSVDEPGTSHAMIASALAHPADYSSATVRLDPAARWHDGTPITAGDVVWSFETLKSLHPRWADYYKNIVSATTSAPGEVTFRFDQAGNRELPNIVGDLVVLPRHWWTGQDAQGRQRDITQPLLEPPLGSGPYRIKEWRTGQSITWERVANAWAAGKPTRVGRYNYDRLHYTYLRDQNATWEAFKKGGLDDFRLENNSQRWSQGYDFPAARDGAVRRLTLPNTNVQPMQAYVLNNRLPKFADRRVREALTLAFNFEEMNRTLFFGLNERISSHWYNSELAATGLPSPAELVLLEPLRGKIPDAVFTTAFKLPTYADAGATRDNLRAALALLNEAGFELRGTALVDARTGEPFTIEMLGSDPSDNRVLEPYARQLQRLGIRASVRLVDTNQFTERMRNFDFEVVGKRYDSLSHSPGNEQRDFWSSAAADTPGSHNYAGIKDEAVDRLIEAIVYAKDRDGLVAATRALDRVMLWNAYVVPQWTRTQYWLAVWDKLAIPLREEKNGPLDPFAWWVAGPGSAPAQAGTAAPEAAR